MYSKPSKSIAFALCAIVVAVGVYYVGFDPQFDSIASKQESAEVQSPEALAITPGEAGDPAALDWCSEHAVPESQCTQCNPALIDSFKASGDWCGGHGIPESHCRLCNPEIEFPQEITLRALRETEETGSIEVSLLSRPNEAVCATNDAVITLAGSTTAERIGLQTVMVTTAELRPTMSAPAEVVFDEEHSVVVSISAPALVTRWLVSAGEFVERDDILAYVQSPLLGELQADLLAASAELKLAESEQRRHDELKARSLISDSDYERQTAQTERARAEIERLRGLLLSGGMNRGDIDECLKHATITDRFPLRSPATGLIVDRSAKLGELLPSGRAFLTLADPSHLWIEAQLAEQQLRNVRTDDELVFSADGGGLGRVGARVIWISQTLDPHTRTGTVRAEVNDPSIALQSGLFGRATIYTQTGDPVTLVPRDAVQWEGCCNIVFVKETDHRFRPRKVTIGAAEHDYYQITSGLEPGESVVTAGAFLLKTELKKSSIGAGCCGIEPAG